MKCCDLFLLVVIFFCYFCFTESGLTLNGAQCGQKVCKYGEYCSEFDRTCRPCLNICNSSTHNYDPTLCMRDCQDYLHDVRYVQKDEKGSPGSENLRATVIRLSHMVTVTLTLVCFMLVILVSIFCLQCYNWKKKKNITFATIKNKLFSKKSRNVESANNNKSTAQSKSVPDPISKPDLFLKMPNSATNSDHSPITTTTTISRRPAEDSTLDYAYDNPAMSASPSPNSKPNESSL